LLLFNLRLEICGQRVLPAYYGSGDAVPELERFIGELFLERWYNLRDRVQWIEINDEYFVLDRRQYLSFVVAKKRDTDRNLGERLITKCVVDLVLPVAFYPREDFLV
jgi:hypothetical protein